MADISKITIESGTYNIKDETARNNINNLNNRINSKNIIFIGDSYAQNDRSITGWGDKVITYLGNKNNYNVTVLKKGGIGFVHTNDDINALILLQNNSNLFSDKTLISDIVVCMGYNDQSHTQEQITAKISEFITYVKTNYINAKVHIGCVGWTSASGTAGDIANLRKVQRSYAMCGMYGGAYINGIENTLHNYNTDFYTDNFHPSEIGTSKIARNLCSYILGGGISNNVEFQACYSNAIYQSQSNDVCNMFIYRDVQINKSFDSIACDGDHTYELVGSDNITPITFQGINEGGNNWAVPVLIHSTSQGYFLVMAKLFIGKTITITPYYLSGTNAWLSINNVNWVKLFKNTFEVQSNQC